VRQAKGPMPPQTPSDPGLTDPKRVRVLGRVPEQRPEIRSYVEQRLLSALGHLARRVECAAVTADQVEMGPLKGAFRCHVWARHLRGRQLREERIDADLYDAIDQAAEALARDVEYVESRLPTGEALRCA